MGKKVSAEVTVKEIRRQTRRQHTAEERGLKFDGMTPEELVAQRLLYVEKTRQSYREFWEKNVAVRQVRSE